MSFGVKARDVRPGTLYEDVNRRHVVCLAVCDVDVSEGTLTIFWLNNLNEVFHYTYDNDQTLTLTEP